MQILVRVVFIKQDQKYKIRRLCSLLLASKLRRKLLYTCNSSQTPAYSNFNWTILINKQKSFICLFALHIVCVEQHPFDIELSSFCYSTFEQRNRNRKIFTTFEFLNKLDSLQVGTLQEKRKNLKSKSY